MTFGSVVTHVDNKFLCLVDITRLGIAVYDQETCCLHVTEVWETDLRNFSNIQNAILQTRPTVIVTSSRTNEELIGILKKNGENETKYTVEILKSSDFSYEAAKGKMMLLQFSGIPENATPQERLLSLASRIDFENLQMVRAIGGLIHFLLKKRLVIELEEHNQSLLVNTIKSLRINKLLTLDVVTLRALQIFQNEAHPSAHSVGKPKEGLSLYAILNRTQSIVGKQMLRNWLLQPLQELQEIEERLDGVSFFSKPETAEHIFQLKSYLKCVKDVAKILVRIRAFHASVTDWYHLFQTIVHVLRIKDICRFLNMDLKIFEKMSKVDDSPLFMLANSIDSTIDFEKSREEGRLIVKGGINEELDELKITYSELDNFLDLVGKEELKRHTFINALRVMYFPQLGFQIAIPIQSNVSLEEQTNLPGFHFQFHTSSFIYFKNDTTDELDRYFGDIHHKIVDLEDSIVRRITSSLLSNTSQLLELVDIIAELDCLISFAEVAKEYNYTRPIVTTENVIYIENGRHPLQELCVRGPFIPNNTAIAYGREGAMKLITGPNFSGKSVYLKQVALITYMTHIGCFVPCEAARIGLTTKILTRIQSRESVAIGKSSFLIDLQQIKNILTTSDERTLLIIDEFGKGTNQFDGVALLSATIEWILKQKEHCPKTLISTHFSELFEYDLLPKDPNLELLTMDIMLKNTPSHPEIIFLYKLVKGFTAFSYGNYCALIAGLPIELLERANEIHAKLLNDETIEPVITNKWQNKLTNIVQLFECFDCDHGDLKKFFNQIFQND